MPTSTPLNPDQVKRCPRCKVDKPREAFSKHRGTKDGLQHGCKPCQKVSWANQYRKNKDHYAARAKAYEKAHPAERLDRYYRTNYAIDLAEYERMFAAQDGRCAICAKEQSQLRTKLAVDHDHATGVVRGLLCSNCNRGIGHLGDTTLTVSKAVEYLLRSEHMQRGHRRAGT